jgi:hypothetical protein
MFIDVRSPGPGVTSLSPPGQKSAKARGFRQAGKKIEADDNVIGCPLTAISAPLMLLWGGGIGPKVLPYR